MTTCLLCPHCNKTHCGTLNTRLSGNDVRRRWACFHCGHRWTTKEVRSEGRLVGDGRFRLTNVPWAEVADGKVL